MDNGTNGGYDDRTIGRRLRMIRNSRKKSLRVIAGLAGISASHLSRIENGLIPLDRRSDIVALARALAIAPSELTALPIPAPGNGGTDAAVGEVRGALLAVSMDSPGGRVVGLDELRGRVTTLRATRRACRDNAVGRALPALIRDLHTSVATGHDGAALAELAVSLHISGTLQWLRDAGASPDLRWHPVALAEQAAQRLDDPLPLGVAAFGTATVLLSAGAFELARQRIDRSAPDVSTGTDAGERVVGMLALTNALVAASQGRNADVDAPLAEAAELALRTGEDDDRHPYWALSFGPANVEVWRASIALETGDRDRAVSVCEGLRPEMIPSPKRRAAFLIDYGRALAPTRRRYDDAVRALRQAELLSPLRMQRNPFAREVLAELHARSPKRDDAIGRELRGMAYRAGLPV